MKTLILICALGTFRQDCSIETATVVVQGPEATNFVQCGFLGQAYLADTALAAYVEDGHYLKILCTSGVTLDPARMTVANLGNQVEAAFSNDHYPSE